MKVLNLFSRKKTTEVIYTIVNGKVFDVSEVNDKVFSSKMMGESVAFLPEDDTIVAPCNGKISIIAGTKHALWLINEIGMEVMIHVGLNTVELNGEGFEVLVKVNQEVKMGDPIIRFDKQKFLSKGIDLTSILAITNSDDYNIAIKELNKKVNAKESIVMDCSRKEG